MVLGFLIIALAITSVAGIILFYRLNISNKTAEQKAPYNVIRNLWIAITLGVGLLVIAAIGLSSGIMSAIPYLDTVEASNNLGNAYNIIAIIANILVSAASFAYLIMMIVAVLVGVAIYIQLVLIVYGVYCIKHKILVTTFYKAYILVSSIISILIVIFSGIEIGSIILAL